MGYNKFDAFTDPNDKKIESVVVIEVNHNLDDTPYHVVEKDTEIGWIDRWEDESFFDSLEFEGNYEMQHLKEKFGFEDKWDIK